MKSETRSRRVFYFDDLRVIATAAVVMLHVSSQNWYDLDPSSGQWQVLNIFNSLTRWAVPVFLMISGGLFLEGTRDIAVIWKKNILRMVTAFLFWSCVYTLHSSLSRDYTIVELVTSIVHGHFHMWYIYVTVGIYLAVPVLKQVVGSEPVRKYFMLIVFLFAILLPSAATYTGGVIESVQIMTNDVLNQMKFPFASVYVFYFVLGHLLHTTHMEAVWRKRVYALGILGLLATVGLSSVRSVMDHVPVSVFYEPHTLNVLAMSTAVFVYAKYRVEDGFRPEKGRVWIGKLSKYSFGVYLAHMLAMYLVPKVFSVNTLSFHPLLAVPLVWILTVCVSLLISVLLNHIPILKKYIV